MKSTNSTMKKILCMALIAAMVGLPVSSPLSLGDHGSTAYAANEQANELYAVAQLYINYYALSPEERNAALSALTDAQKGTLDSLLLGALELCVDANGQYFTRVPEGLTDAGGVNGSGEENAVPDVPIADTAGEDGQNGGQNPETVLPIDPEGIESVPGSELSPPVTDDIGGELPGGLELGNGEQVLDPAGKDNAPGNLPGEGLPDNPMDGLNDEIVDDVIDGNFDIDSSSGLALGSSTEEGAEPNDADAIMFAPFAALMPMAAQNALSTLTLRFTGSIDLDNLQSTFDDAVKALAVVELDDSQLADSDYSLDLSNVSAAPGTYLVTASHNDGSGTPLTASAYVTVYDSNTKDKTIKEITLTKPSDSYVLGGYDATTLIGVITMENGDTPSYDDADFKVTVSGSGATGTLMTVASTYTITVTGIGSGYSGSKSAQFTITDEISKIEPASSTVEWDENGYDATSLITIVMKESGQGIRYNDKDFGISVTGGSTTMTSPGVYTVTVTGKDPIYSGSAEAYFTITDEIVAVVPASSTVEWDENGYDAKDVIQSIITKATSTSGIEYTATDFEISVTGPDVTTGSTEMKKPGVYTITVTGATGSIYTESAEAEFIIWVGISGVELNASTEVYTPAGYAAEDKIKNILMSNDDKVTYVKGDPDFEIAVTGPDGSPVTGGMINAGTYAITVTGKGSVYKEISQPVEFTIEPIELNFTISGLEKYYGQDNNQMTQSTASTPHKGILFGSSNPAKEYIAKVECVNADLPDEALTGLSFYFAATDNADHTAVTIEEAASGKKVRLDGAETETENYTIKLISGSVDVKDYYAKDSANEDVKITFDEYVKSAWTVSDTDTEKWWYIGDKLTIKSTVGGFDIALAKEGETSILSDPYPDPQTASPYVEIYTVPADLYGKGITDKSVKFYVRNMFGDKDTNSKYMAIDTRYANYALTFDYDNEYLEFGELTVTATVRDKAIKVAYKESEGKGENSLVVYPSYKKTETDEKGKDVLFELVSDTSSRDKGTVVVRNGNEVSIPIDSETYTVSTFESNSDPLRKLKTYTQLNYLPEKTEITYEVFDYAGNAGTEGSVQVEKYTPEKLTIKCNRETTTSKGDLVVPSNGSSSFKLTGEPGEIVRIIHKQMKDGNEVKFIYYLQLAFEGEAKGTGEMVFNETDSLTFSSDSENVDVDWISDSSTEHLTQWLTFEYADKEHLTSICSDTVTFVYDHKAWPLTDPNLYNRDFRMTIELSEEGTINYVQVNGVSLINTTTGSNTTHTFDSLTWNGTPPNLLPAGSGLLSISYTDLGGNHESKTFPISRSTVTTPILMSVEPEGNENSRVNGQYQRMRVYGTSTEYETIVLEIPGVLKVETIASGAGDYGESGAEAGTWSALIDLTLLPRDVLLTLTASYRDVNGTPDSIQFIYDDKCLPTILTSPVFEGCYIISGITEPGAQVTIRCGSEVVKAQVDNFGVFVAQMPLVFEGEIIVVRAIDLAGNTDELEVTVGPEEDMHAMKGYMLGKLYTTQDTPEEALDWVMASYLTRTELSAGVTLDIIAANSFVVGKVTVSLNAEGKLTYSYELEDGIELDSQYFMVSDVMDIQAFLTHALPNLSPDQASALDAAADGYWVCAEFMVQVPTELLENTFQLDSYSDNATRRLYRNRQRSASLLSFE